jgi:hypothetical protein
MKIHDLHKKIINRWPDWYCQIKRHGEELINEHGYNYETSIHITIYDQNKNIKFYIVVDSDVIFYTYTKNKKDIDFLNQICDELRTENTTNS